MIAMAVTVMVRTGNGGRSTQRGGGDETGGNKSKHLHGFISL
jgi:hypothetical protein